MSRINIEDSLFSDRRWMKLLLKTGCEHKALGLVCGAWILAQKHWLKDGSIPAKAWPQDLEVLIEVELATRRQDGSVYVKGSKKAFAWLEQRSEAGSVKNDKKTAAAEAARIAKEQKRQAQLDAISLNARSKTQGEISERSLNETDRALNGSEPPSPIHSPPLSPSPSLSSDSDSFHPSGKEKEPLNDRTEPKKKKPKPSPESVELNRKIREAYEVSFSARYRVRPVINAAVNAKISQLGKRLGNDAPLVVEFFLKHNDGFYLKKIHDIGLCLKDAESLHAQWQRGRTVTSQDVRNYEKNANTANLIKDAQEGGF